MGGFKVKQISTKILALDELLGRGFLNRKSFAFVCWLKSNTRILDRSRFVTDASYAPDILILSENNEINQVILFLGNSTEDNNKESTEEYMQKLIDNSVCDLQQIVRMLSSFNKELYISLDLNPAKEAGKALKSVIDDNLHLSRVLEQDAHEKEEQNRIVNKAIDVEIEVANLKQELDKALASRDFTACAEINQKLKALSLHTLKEVDFKL